MKQFLNGNHVKRGQTAHLITLQALPIQYQNAFFKSYPEESKSLEKLSKKLADACTKGTKDKVKEANTKLVQAIESQCIMEKIAMFDAAQEKKPMFIVFRQYMRKVMKMFAFIKAVRTGDWMLHLTALETFTKYFFVHDCLNYARMIPLYLAEMATLETSDPEVYSQFLQGNWVVNKNANVPFCTLQADHGLEHVNCSMEVS